MKVLGVAGSAVFMLFSWRNDVRAGINGDKLDGTVGQG